MSCPSSLGLVLGFPSCFCLGDQVVEHFLYLHSNMSMACLVRHSLLKTPLDATKDSYIMIAISESIYCFLWGTGERTKQQETPCFLVEHRTHTIRKDRCSQTWKLAFAGGSLRNCFDDLELTGLSVLLTFPTHHHPQIATEVKSSRKIKKRFVGERLGTETKNFEAASSKKHKAISNGRADIQ